MKYEKEQKLKTIQTNMNNKKKQILKTIKPNMKYKI